MAFLSTERNLRNITLNGKELPWISSIKHLSSTITNNFRCRMGQDTGEKRAAYIAKNNELNQEFHYAHPRTKIWVNNIYNSSFYGAPLWDLFSRDFEKLEKSWNVSQRIMLSLPRKTHRYFLEPLSDTHHIVKSIKKRFLGFLNKIRSSKKEVLRCVLRKIERDCRSTTGRNIRSLKLQNEETTQKLFETPYVTVPEDELWRLEVISELIEVKTGKMNISTMSKDEINDIIETLCCT